MTDRVDASVGGQDEVLSSLSGQDRVAGEIGDLASIPGNVESISSAPIGVDEVSELVQDVAEINASVETLLLFMLVEKLNSIEWNATYGPFDYIKLADITSKGTGTGNSVVWEGTDSPQTVLEWYMPPSWARDQGAVDITLTGAFENGGAGSIVLQVNIYVADAPPTSDDTAAASFGLPQSAASAYQWESAPIISTAGGPGRWSLHITLDSEGHTGTTWSQCASTQFMIETRPAVTPKLDITQHTVDETNIDPTTAKWISVTFQATAALGASQSLTVKGGRAALRHKRDAT